MKKINVRRPGVRAGYDSWSTSYDSTPNPLVTLDRRHTIGFLRPRRGERVLDAACGTGGHLSSLLDAGSRPVGLDFSMGMLQVARRSFPKVDFAQADLGRSLPVRPKSADKVLCALVGEHLTDLRFTVGGFFESLRPGGRFVFSNFHPELAASGIEANFQKDGKEIRLGAERHTVDDYVNVVEDSGFKNVEWREFQGDETLAREIPKAEKYLDRPLLLVVTGERPRE